jgi:hypothetical protein
MQASSVAEADPDPEAEPGGGSVHNLIDSQSRIHTVNSELGADPAPSPAQAPASDPY